MKLLILSDIHSNPACLEAILDAESDADAIYCAGDLVDYGPDPESVIDLIRKYNIHTVCGNHDRRVVRLWNEWDRQAPQTGLRWAQHNIQKLEVCVNAANVADTANAKNTDLPEKKANSSDPIKPDDDCSNGTNHTENYHTENNSIDNCHADNCHSDNCHTVNYYYQYLKELPRFLSFTADGVAYLMTHQYGDEYETIESAWHFNKFWNEHFDPVECGLTPENGALSEYRNMPRRMIFGHTHRQMQVIFADQTCDAGFSDQVFTQSETSGQKKVDMQSETSGQKKVDMQRETSIQKKVAVQSEIGGQPKASAKSKTIDQGKATAQFMPDGRSAATGNHPESLWINPGSASYRRPDEPSKDAFYAVIENGHIQMKHITYDRSPIYDQVMAVQDQLDPDELRVAQFFFGWTEADGPDYEWISHIRSQE